MYKNFNLTEKERQQIMEMHQSRGYKKPMNEQSAGYDDAMDTMDMEQSTEESKFITLVFQERGNEETGEYENDLTNARAFMDYSQAGEYLHSLENGVQIKIPLI